MSTTPLPHESVPAELLETVTVTGERRSRRAVPSNRPDTAFDVTMRRLLRIPQRVTGPSDATLYRTFSTSITISALRCLLTYVLFPIVSPALGLATGVGPAIGIPVALIALFFDVLGLRRFWLANHRLRHEMTFVYAAVMLMVTSLLILDLVHLAS